MHEQSMNHASPKRHNQMLCEVTHCVGCVFGWGDQEMELLSHSSQKCGAGDCKDTSVTSHIIVYMIYI